MTAENQPKDQLENLMRDGAEKAQCIIQKATETKFRGNSEIPGTRTHFHIL